MATLLCLPLATLAAIRIMLQSKKEKMTTTIRVKYLDYIFDKIIADFYFTKFLHFIML